VAEDGTIFVAEIDTIEGFKAGKSVFQEKAKFAPSAIAVSKKLVAVGAEV
jgi:WD repeat-containing protein 1 (actin-interacting protein 1)